MNIPAFFMTNLLATIFQIAETNPKDRLPYPLETGHNNSTHFEIIPEHPLSASILTLLQ